MDTRIVVSIDFGTSRSGYAIAFKGSSAGAAPKVIVRNRWPGQPIPSAKTLTEILYDSSGAISAWGFEVPVQLARLKHDGHGGSHHPKRYLKLQLLGSRDAARAGGAAADPLPAITDFLRLLKDEALRDLTRMTAGQFDAREILWSLTVPAIWDDAQKGAMRLAARDAGLLAPDGDEERLLLVLEPEAAAVHCAHSAHVALPAGSTLMVIDGGGGTVDLTTLEVRPDGRFDVLTRADGNRFGSFRIDQAFVEHLTSILGRKILEDFADRHPLEHAEMQADWERFKCAFDPSRSPMTYLRLPNPLYELLRVQHPDVLAELGARQGGDTMSLHLSRDVVEGFFQDVIAQACHEVRLQLGRLGSRRCDHAFLVGGLAESPLLQRALRLAFGPDAIGSFVLPEEPGAAVLIGAVLCGLQDPLRARPARSTYGVRAHRPFRQGDPEERRVTYAPARRRKDDCADCFITLVRAGQVIGKDEFVEHAFSPVDPQDTQSHIDILACDDGEPPYADSPGVQVVGSLVVPRTPSPSGSRSRLRVKLLFGRSEVVAHARDEAADEEVVTRLVQVAAGADAST